MTNNVIPFPVKTSTTETLWSAKAMMVFEDNQYKMKWTWSATLPNNNKSQ